MIICLIAKIYKIFRSVIFVGFGFIGAGNMASAIIKGMVSNGFDSKCIYVYDIKTEMSQELNKLCGINVCNNIKDLILNSETIILAVKPNILQNVLSEISSIVDKNKHVVISIAAGKTLDYISDFFEDGMPIIRVMPNINAKVLEASSGFCKNKFVNQNHVDIVKKLFSTVGTITEIDEQYFSIFGVVAGSSPAFAYLFIDSLARAGVKAGLNKKTALKIAAQTVMGSAKMILESDEHPWELIDQVCSPGGTTIEGIASLQNNGFESAVIKACDASLEKDFKMQKS